MQSDKPVTTQELSRVITEEFRRFKQEIIKAGVVWPGGLPGPLIGAACPGDFGCCTDQGCCANAGCCDNQGCCVEQGCCGDGSEAIARGDVYEEIGHRWDILAEYIESNKQPIVDFFRSKGIDLPKGSEQGPASRRKRG